MYRFQCGPCNLWGYGQRVTIKTSVHQLAAIIHVFETEPATDSCERFAMAFHDPAAVMCSAEYHQSEKLVQSTQNRVSWRRHLMHSGTFCPITGRNRAKDSWELVDHNFESRLRCSIKKFSLPHLWVLLFSPHITSIRTTCWNSGKRWNFSSSKFRRKFYCNCIAAIIIIEISGLTLNGHLVSTNNSAKTITTALVFLFQVPSCHSLVLMVFLRGQLLPSLYCDSLVPHLPHPSPHCHCGSYNII